MSERATLVELYGAVEKDSALQIVLGRLGETTLVGEDDVPDLILMVDRMPNTTLDLVKDYTKRFPEARIIVSSSIPEILEASLTDGEKNERFLIIAPHAPGSIEAIATFLQK